MANAQVIRERLAALQPVTLDLRDESAQHAGHAGARPGGGSHWQVTIVSDRAARALSMDSGTWYRSRA